MEANQLQVSLYAALQSIPRSLIEAAQPFDGAPDSAASLRLRTAYRSSSFFLLVVNLVYAFFDTYQVIEPHPGGAGHHDADL